MSIIIGITALKQKTIVMTNFTWGERPFWFREDRQGEDSPLVLGYWGVPEDWAEPNIRKKCYLGNNRVQVFDRIKVLLSF